jgi:sortase A
VRSALRALSTVLIVAGALLLIDAGLTLVWQEPVSAFLAHRDQARLAKQLKTLQAAPPTGIEQRALAALRDARERMAFLARTMRRRSPEGAAVGRIRIPHIGANFVLVNGTSHDDLTKGPGVYPQTPFPGVPGTTAIAGHRTTYLAPFRHIDELKPGDHIVVEMPYGRFTYAVQRHIIVDPTAVWVIRRNSEHGPDTHYSRLILSACNPLYSAAQRIIVIARLIRSEPRGAALSAVGDQTLTAKPKGL